MTHKHNKPANADFLTVCGLFAIISLSQDKNETPEHDISKANPDI